MFGKKKKPVDVSNEELSRVPLPPVEVMETNQANTAKPVKVPEISKEQAETLAKMEKIVGYWKKEYNLSIFEPTLFSGNSIIADLLLCQIYEMKELREEFKELKDTLLELAKQE
jgi:hypothetical protein